MKKFKIGNIVFISLAILVCIISFITVLVNGGETKTLFTYLTLVSFAALVFALVLTILSKEKLMMIPMLVVFLNSFFLYNMLNSSLAAIMEQAGASKYYGMDTFEFVMLVLAILGIVFTCLKQKWGAIVGIVGIAYMIYAQNSLIYGFAAIKDNISQYSVIAWNATSVLFQFVWLLLPMIFFLCEKPKKEEVPQVEEQQEEVK